MTDAEDFDDEFEQIIAHSSAHTPSVRVVEIAEAATMVEFEVPLEVSPHPEATLFQVVSEYLEQNGTRRAVVGFNIIYQLNGGAASIVASLLLSTDSVEKE